MSLPPFPSVGEVVPGESTTWLIIDTNRYSGNFERDLCAFVTGRYGECEVGMEVAERVLLEAPGALDWTEEAISLTPDEHGVYRPVKIEQTPGWVQDRAGNHYPETMIPPHVELSQLQWAYQSVAISFERGLSVDELQQLMRRAAQFPRDESYLRFYPDVPLSILGYRVIEERTTRFYTARYTVSGVSGVAHPQEAEQ